MFASLVACASLLASVHVAVSAPTSSIQGMFKAQGCSTDGLQFSPIPGQPVFTPPAEAPSFVYAAVGVQNYTCNTSTGTYTSAGAVAELFDATCILKTSGESSATVADALYQVWTAVSETVTIQEIISSIQDTNPEFAAGQHYFISNGDGTISPTWDARASGKTIGNPNAIVVGKVANTVPAPTGSQDVNWLKLDKVRGDLATTIFRTDTRGGQPPASCANGAAQAISVDYAAFYFLYGSSL